MIQEFVMTRIVDMNEVWYTNLGEDSSFSQKLLHTAQHNKLSLHRWNNKSLALFGLIFIDGIEAYSQLVSFLNFQLKDKSNRIIVINLSPYPLNKSEVLKI